MKMGGGKRSKTSGKVRFDGVDVAAMVSHLQRTLLGRRIINIYDGMSEGSDGYLFKLDGGNGKAVLFLESGIRFHTTSHQSSLQQEGMPSPFCSKLRKHLRGKRLERVVQLGNLDRVIELTFGTGGTRHSLILELYARGNLLLTNKKYEILSLLRSHEYAEQDVQVRVGNVYPVTFATSMGLQEEKPSGDSDAENTQSNGILGMSGADAKQWALSQLAPKEDMTSTSPEGESGKKGSGKGGKKGSNAIPLKALLLKPTSGVHHYGPSLIEHCILCAELDPNLKVSADSLQELVSVSAWETLGLSLREEGSKVLERLVSEEMGGYILYRTKESGEDAADQHPDALEHAGKVFEEFQPHLLKQHEGRPVIRYDTFAEAVDDFFFHIGGQKRALRAEAAEATAREKLEKVRKDQERRVETLLQEQEKLREHAQLVKYHADDVDKALSVINSALDTGMDWEALEQLVEVEQKNENPIALLIKKLDLDKDSMVLSLPDMLSDNGEGKSVDVSVSLKESAFGNVRDMFDAYRAAKEKTEKTLEASTKALKAAEATAQRQLADAQKRARTAATLAPQRKAHWFEKFHWFITSDNYLVLGGRDAQQNETLVKRYLRPGDAYLHADVPGAASCVLRAKRRRTAAGGKTQVLPLSDQALREAGNFTVCLSSAWASRMVTSAWWVEPSQVSKTAPTGEYLTVGSFMVRGKKNFLPPSQLEMGLAVLFRLGDDDSIARHKNERRDFALLDNDADILDEDVADMSIKEESKLEREELVERSKSEGSAPLLVEESEKAADAPFTDIAQAAISESVPSVDEVLNDSDDQIIDSQAGMAVEGEVDKQVENKAQGAQIAQEPNAADEKTKKKKKGLSVRERKLIKKHGSLKAAEKAAAERDQNEQTTIQASKSKSSGSEGDQKADSQHKRGKKSKLKRAAKKYDHQDEEDRELAMLALQGGEKKAEKKKNGKRGRTSTSISQQKAAAEAAALLVKDSSKVVEALPESVQAVLASCVSVKSPDSEDVVVRWEKFDADVLELLIALDSEEIQLAAANRLLFLKQSSRVDNFSASLAGIVRTIKKYGHENLEVSAESAAADGARRKTKAEKEREKEAWREALAEEGIIEEHPEDGEEMVDDTAELSRLTGKPNPDDVLLYAIPVCAPYQTLSKYKYKVKLTPGAQKKGKAAKQCLEMFLKGGNDTSFSKERDKELIKRVGDNAWVQAICPNVKISAPGASKASKKQKGGGKKGRKK